MHNKEIMRLSVVSGSLIVFCRKVRYKKFFNKPVDKITSCVTVKSLKETSCRKPTASAVGMWRNPMQYRGYALNVEGSMLSVNSLNSQHSSLGTMRGIYNTDFTVDVLPQAALRLHAVNCTQPLQGCITTT